MDEAEERLAPLGRARNAAWWDANVEASEENERRRNETDLAYTDALADPDLYAALGRASADGDHLLGRRIELLRNLMLPHQVDASLRARILELEAADPQPSDATLVPSHATGRALGTGTVPPALAAPEPEVADRRGHAPAGALVAHSRPTTRASAARTARTGSSS